MATWHDNIADAAADVETYYYASFYMQLQGNYYSGTEPATAEPGEPDNANGRPAKHSGWFAWRQDRSGTASIVAYGEGYGYSSTHVFEAFTGDGTLGGLTRVLSVAPGAATQAKTTLQVTAGQTYYFRSDVDDPVTATSCTVVMPQTFTGGWFDNPYNWGTAVFDLGPWLGGLDLTSIPADLLPLGTSEVELQVAYPPTDGDYVMWDANYPDGSTYMPAPYVSTNSNGSTYGPYDSMPTGPGLDGSPLHLYLVWYDANYSSEPNVPQPTFDPYALVPPEWVAGGTAGFGSPPPPPPYVVSNDSYTTPISLGEATTGIVSTFDNTGATADPGDTSAERSIWYTFTISAQTDVLEISTRPDNTDDFAFNRMVLRQGTALDNTQVLTPRQTSFSMANNVGNTSYYAYLAPGTYLLELYFSEGRAGFWTKGSLTLQPRTNLATNLSWETAIALPPNSGTLENLNPHPLGYALYYTFTPTISGGGYFVLGPWAGSTIQGFSNLTLYFYKPNPDAFGGREMVGYESVVQPDGTIRFSYNVAAGVRYEMFFYAYNDTGSFPFRYMVRTVAALGDWVEVPPYPIIGINYFSGLQSTELRTVMPGTRTDSWSPAHEEPINYDAPFMQAELLSGRGFSRGTDLIQNEQNIADDTAAAKYAADVHIRPDLGIPNGSPFYSAIGAVFADGPGIDYRNPVGPAAWVTKDQAHLAGYVDYSQQEMSLFYAIFWFRSLFDRPAVGTAAWSSMIGTSIRIGTFYFDPLPGTTGYLVQEYDPNTNQYIMINVLGNAYEVAWNEGKKAFIWENNAVPASRPDDFTWKFDLGVFGNRWWEPYTSIFLVGSRNDSSNAGMTLSLRSMGQGLDTFDAQMYDRGPTYSVRMIPREGWQGNLDHWPLIERIPVPHGGASDVPYGDRQVVLGEPTQQRSYTYPFVKGEWHGYVANTDFQEGRNWDNSYWSNYGVGAIASSAKAGLNIDPKVMLTLPRFRIGDWTEDIQPIDQTDVEIVMWRTGYVGWNNDKIIQPWE